MSRPVREKKLRGGLGIVARFALPMSIALTAVMAVAGVYLVSKTRAVTKKALEHRVADALSLTVEELRPGNFEQSREELIRYPEVDVLRFDVVYGLEKGQRLPASLYEYRGPGKATPDWRLLVPLVGDETVPSLIGPIAGITLAVILVGTFVSFFVAARVSKLLERVVEDIRQIVRGDFRRRSQVEAGGQITLLARLVNRMAEELEEAQETQLQLSMREREMAVAAEVREALNPDQAPVIAGYDLAARHVASPQPGGDFHDFIELEDGRVGLLVCGVSGQGVPGALVAATARSYLRSELARPVAISEALCKVNGFLALDVRRGMYVTAMYVLLDARSSTAEVACAGHKVPLLRVSRADGKIRAVQPEGIALGFDRGPVFERTLKIQRVALERGDRLLLANTGALSVVDPQGTELGEKGFYRLILKHARQGSAALLEALEQSFYEHAGDAPLPNDVSIITVAREG